MIEVFELYKKDGIDLACHNETNMYALSKSNALKFLELAEKYHIMIEGVDILYKDADEIYSYLVEPNKYVHWDLKNLNLMDRILFLKKAIHDYSIVDDLYNIVFAFIDNQSFKVYDLLHTDI